MIIITKNIAVVTESRNVLDTKMERKREILTGIM
jgi:hypothetical protein